VLCRSNLFHQGSIWRRLDYHIHSKLVKKERKNGTFAAAAKHSVTFGSNRSMSLYNRVFGDLPDGKVGSIDQDWWMDLVDV
jgi:hypothetical protein